MASKKKNLKKKRVFYNNEITSEISRKLLVGDFNGALVLAEEYVEDYPDDDLGNFYIAKALLALGRKDEAYALAKHTFESKNFHNQAAIITAFYHYSKILFGVGRKEDSLDLLTKAIEIDSSKSIDEKSFLNLYLTLINLLTDNNDYDIAASYSQAFYDKYGCDVFLLKKATALKHLNHRKEALELFENLRFDNKELEQERLMGIGSIYSYMFLDFKEFKYLSRSDEAYHKVLSKKNDSYYVACLRLGFNATHRDDFVDAIKYANKVIDKYKGTTEDNYIRLLHEAYRIMGYAYLGLGDLDKVKEYIDLVPEEANGLLILNYLFSTRQFNEAIEFCEKRLSYIDDDDMLNKFLSFYINSLIRIGELDKALYIMNNVDESLNKGFIEKATAFIYTNKGVECPNFEYYSAKQLKDYSEEETIEHICKRHLNHKGALNFCDRKQAIQLLKEAKGLIDVNGGIPTGLLDLHILKFDGVKLKEDVDCYAISAVTLPGTNKITTLFPIISSRSTYKFEHQSKGVKVKSGLERFNSRYGNN